ncbi:MAG: hypothetical protein P8Q14_04690 [Vicingaceae bacterium]|nr:hypothetical protein [Vicingaceae bacterium]
MKITFTKQEITSLIESSLSWMVALMMLTYGFGKIVQFTGTDSTEKVVSQLSGMELMWTFYGHSFIFALIIGTFEVIGGILLLLKRTRVLGCFLLTAILTNVIIQDIVFEVHKGALYSAIIYQLCISIIIWFNRTKIITAFRLLTNKNIQEQQSNKISKYMILTILFILFLLAQHYLAHFLSLI